jgi:hypothetical protein
VLSSLLGPVRFHDESVKEILTFAVDNEHHYALHTNRGAALERLGRLEDAIEV